jgi:uncharacterized protein (TIGR00251 family)
LLRTPAVRSAADRPWTAAEAGIRVRVRLSPKSARDGVDGVEVTAEGPALVVRVRAAPEKGEANRALVKTFAAWLDVPKSTIGVTRGHKSRSKMLLVAGDPGQLAALMAARLGRSGAG